ncbi:MAG: hypothetical protein HQK49_19325 [Oligoflexia bacterium]|nr:hypothetical protein [Oligoflexia bacterium]
MNRNTDANKKSHSFVLKYKDVKEFAPIDMETGIDLKTQKIVSAEDLAPVDYELRPKCKFCKNFKLDNNEKSAKTKTKVGENYEEKGKEGICLVSDKKDKNGKVIDLTYEETPVFNCKKFKL